MIFVPFCGLVLKEFEADRRGDLFDQIQWLKTAGVSVNRKTNDVVAALIGNPQIVANRVDRKIARPISLCPDMLDKREPPVASIDPEYDDAIVPAV